MNTALLFAAGRGLRLRPLTDTIPKPLVRINNKPLIDYHLEKLALSAIKRVLINHAYLGDQIKRHIHRKYDHSLEIIYIPEPPGGFLTGGTVLNVLSYMKDEPFLAINADIFTHYDFSTRHLPSGSLAHLVLVEPPQGRTSADFGLNHKQQLNNTHLRYVFSGIACYDPALFKNKHRGRVSLVPWLKEAADNGCATGEIYQGLWFDTGTPEALENARQA